MKSIHVLRKPCSAPTVAANVLRHGTGALNINATRIAHSNPSDLDSHRKMVEAIKSRGGHMAHSWKNSSDLSGANDVSTAGRWPANLVLQHLDGCRQDGTRNVRSSDRPGHGHKQSPVHIVGPTHRHSEVRHGNLDGTETVAAWACVEGCPVAALDGQSGVLKSPSTYVRGSTGVNQSVYGSGVGQVVGTTSLNFGDTGGASRFFKQVKP